MELTCSRCHQTVRDGDCFCPVCGLPQLVYTAEGSTAQDKAEQWLGAVRDASEIDWKPALRAALALAIPAGLFCSIPLSGGIFGLLLMAGTAAWVVALYMRIQRPAWITIGAGARIGLVTGILAGAMAFAANGAALFVQRYGFHQGNRIDSDWKSFVDMDMQLSQQISSVMGPSDPAQVATLRMQQQALMLSPEGHAGMVIAELAIASLFFVFFAMTGGAVCARMLGRNRRPQT
jgi:hypothetical protein